MADLFRVGGKTTSKSASNTVGAAIDLIASMPTVMFYNKGPNEVFFVTYNSAAETLTADTDDTPLGVGVVMTFNKGTHDKASFRCAAAETATVRATCGYGE